MCILLLGKKVLTPFIFFPFHSDVPRLSLLRSQLSHSCISTHNDILYRSPRFDSHFHLHRILTFRFSPPVHIFNIQLFLIIATNFNYNYCFFFLTRDNVQIEHADRTDCVCMFDVERRELND